MCVIDTPSGAAFMLSLCLGNIEYIDGLVQETPVCSDYVRAAPCTMGTSHEAMAHWSVTLCPFWEQLVVIMAH